jgi:hypothetical protein
MKDARLRELYELQGIDAVKDALKDELSEVHRAQSSWEGERFSWHFNFAGMIIACCLMLWGVGGCINAEGKQSEAEGNKAQVEARLSASKQEITRISQGKEEKAKQYRIMLLENKIDPDTGKAWKGQ